MIPLKESESRDEFKCSVNEIEFPKRDKFKEWESRAESKNDTINTPPSQARIHPYPKKANPPSVSKRPEN